MTKRYIIVDLISGAVLTSDSIDNFSTLNFEEWIIIDTVSSRVTDVEGKFQDTIMHVKGKKD